MLTNKRIRIGEADALFLSILMKHKSRNLCGMDIIRLSENKLVRGSIFSIAASLEEQGFIRSEEEEGVTTSRFRKRFYTLTPSGRSALNLWSQVNQATTRSQSQEGLTLQPC